LGITWAFSKVDLMDFSVCNQCGTEIEGKGIQFRGKSFCGDECCEIFEESQPRDDGPGFYDLDEKEIDELEDDVDENDLGYDKDPTEEKVRNPLDEDDDFEIDPDDF
jgi:hypothetical protein